MKSSTTWRRVAAGLIAATLVDGAMLIAQPVEPEPPARAVREMEQRNGRCDACHACEAPTKEDRCLRTCARAEAMRVAREFQSKHGPRIVILEELESVYLPVPFDHAGHAEMAQMAGGCSLCHHYTPEGLEHPACKSCHAVAAEEADIRKPGLKGAYHRQCMSCHREWSGETSCGVCHRPKAGAAVKGGVELVPTPDDLMGRMHPPIPEPDVELYTTMGGGYTPSKVLFRHKEHIQRYDLRCADCHREDNCNRCHEEGRQHVQQVRTFADHHKPCLECHRDESCEGCHFTEEKGPPSRFDHARAGWPLTRYHADAKCRACHPIPPYGKVDKACSACHPGWSPANFDHVRTGQRLDKRHVGFGCEECHPKRAFDAPPRCDGCHTEDEGIVFPAKRPGETTSAGRTKRTGRSGANRAPETRSPMLTEHGII